MATWSPDGRRIAFGSDQPPTPRLFIKNANGTGAEEPVAEGRAFPTDWGGGQNILYLVDGGPTRLDVWIHDLSTRSSRPLLNSTFNERAARFSPDGKWIAYVSDEARDAQVFVRSFPDGAVKIQVSSAGGNQPEWRRDGNELFYLDADSNLMAASVQSNGGQLVIGTAQPLFRTDLEPERLLRNGFSTSVDGQQFLIMAPVGDQRATPFVAVLNWTSGLARK